MAEFDKLKIQIPRSQRDVVRRLAELSDSDFSALKSALETAGPAIDAQGIAKQVTATSNRSVDDVSEIVHLLLSLTVSRDRYDVTTDQLIADVTSAASEEHLLADEPAVQETFARRLASLLLIDPAITVSSKALDVLLRNQNSFVSARVTTDIRPVFADRSTPEPVGAMILHNLELVSHTNDEHITHYLALDGSEIRTLMNVLERAITKETSLAKVIGDSKLFVLIDTHLHASDET